MMDAPMAFYAKRKRMRLSLGVRQPYGSSRKARKRRSWLWAQHWRKIASDPAMRPTGVIMEMIYGLPAQRTFYPNGNERLELLHGCSQPATRDTALTFIAPRVSLTDELQRFTSGPLAEPYRELSR